MCNALKSLKGKGHLYKTLHPGTLLKMMDNPAGIDKRRKWSEMTLEKVQNNVRKRNENRVLGRPRMLVSDSSKEECDSFTKSLQANRPDILNHIFNELNILRSAGTSIDIHLVRAIFLGCLQIDAPELLQTFKISARYIQKFLSSYLNFSWRSTTQAAGKVPDDWDIQGYLLALRMCASIKELGTPPELMYNADQTGINLLTMSNKTWHPCGDKQVPGVGVEEKCQFTLMLCFTAAGDLVPFQIIFGGKTDRSTTSD